MARKSGLHFRRANIQDAKLLAEMGRRTFETAFGPKNKKEDIQKYLKESFSLSQLESEVQNPDSLFLLAYEDDRPLGYSKLVLGKGHDCIKENNICELRRIYVEPDALGQGVGSELLLDNIRIAQESGCSHLWLGVWEENEDAIRFYQRQGFEKACEQTFVLGSDPQIDWVMIRSL